MPLPTPRPPAISLPHTLISRLPVVGRFVEARAERKLGPPVSPPSTARKLMRLPRRIVGLLAPEKPAPPPPRLAIPFVSPVVRRVRQPIERTARVVQVAREVRKPKTRWERLREAAELALQQPGQGARWERLMGLGMALAAGTPAPPTPPQRSVLRRVLGRQKPVAPVRPPSLGERLGADLRRRLGRTPKKPAR